MDHDPYDAIRSSAALRHVSIVSCDDGVVCRATGRRGPLWYTTGLAEAGLPEIALSLTAPPRVATSLLATAARAVHAAGGLWLAVETEIAFLGRPVRFLPVAEAAQRARLTFAVERHFQSCHAAGIDPYEVPMAAAQLVVSDYDGRLPHDPRHRFTTQQALYCASPN